MQRSERANFLIEFSTAERINPASLKSLWHDSFSEDYQSINLFFNSMYLPENTLIAFNGDTLVSTLYLLPGKISTCNGQYSSIYYFLLQQPIRISEDVE